MTHREALQELFCIPAPIQDSDFKGFKIADVNKWIEQGWIPMAHIPEVAGWIGCKPSDIDDYFIGKDELTIDWSEK